MYKGWKKTAFQKKCSTRNQRDVDQLGVLDSAGLDDVEADLKDLGVRNWKKKAMDREKWKKDVVGKVLAPREL